MFVPHSENIRTRTPTEVGRSGIYQHKDPSSTVLLSYYSLPKVEKEKNKAGGRGKKQEEGKKSRVSE